MPAHVPKLQNLFLDRASQQRDDGSQGAEANDGDGVATEVTRARGDRVGQGIQGGAVNHHVGGSRASRGSLGRRRCGQWRDKRSDGRRQEREVMQWCQCPHSAPSPPSPTPCFLLLGTHLATEREMRKSEQAQPIRA
jgi:hypothetical protein